MAGLTNSRSLGYTGVKAKTPPNVGTYDRDPTTRDYFNHSRGDFWLNVGTTSAPLLRLWVLMSQAANVAIWVLIVDGAGGDLDQLTASDATVATPVLTNITFPDAIIAGSGNIDSNLQSHGTAGLFTINVKPAIKLPTTNAGLTQGVIFLGVNRFLHGFGTANTFLGNASGNNTLTVAAAVQNTGIGNASLFMLTTGASNTAVGSSSASNISTGIDNVAMGNAAMAPLTTGSNNIGIGSNVFSNIGAGLLTGSNNIGIGGSAGNTYTAAESSNILINNIGVVAENNTIRVGTAGGGAGQQNRCFIAGIRGITTGINDAIAVLIDSANQLGTISSSIKYKQNVKDMGEESSILMELRPVVFNYKHHPEVPAWGLIAEEVETVFPQLVVYKNDEPETVKYHELVPLMLNEIQKLNKRISILEREVCDQKVS